MPTILVVEDEQPVRELLVMLFEESGYKVQRANHGRHALELVALEQPDLVLSDVMMPILNGLELCRQLKSTVTTQDIPVILMSAAGTRIAGQANADAVIGKPFDLDDLEQLIQQWLPPTGDHGGKTQAGI